MRDYIMPYVFAMAAILCWASLPTAIGSGLTGLSVPSLLQISFTTAALVLYLRDLVTKRSWKIFFPGIWPSLLGIWGIFIYHLCYYGAMEKAPMAEGAILATTWSFWTVVFASIVQYRRLKPMILITALAGLFGAGLVIASGKDLSFNSAYFGGYGLALFCGLIWSSFSVALPLFRLKSSPMTAFTIYAAVFSNLLAWVTGAPSWPSGTPFWSAVYLGAIPLGLSFYFWDRAITSGRITIIGYLSYLAPPLAVLMLGFVHGAQVSSQVYVGMAVIIFSSLLGKWGMDR
ncbi:MAG: DMT family transporter [Desulfobacterales bacterium]|nr:DMT family transporter [Desulfobacterales bacterium]